MTLDPRAGRVELEHQVALRSYQAQVQVEEVGMASQAEWAVAWATWEDPEDQVAVSPAGGHHLARLPTLDLIISLVLEECLALEEAVEEEVVEEVVGEVFPLEAHPSSICHQISAHQCFLGQDLTPCCRQGAWEVLEEVAHPIRGLACLHSSSMDKVDIRLTAHHYLVVEALEDPRMAPCLQWGEAWVLG